MEGNSRFESKMRVFKGKKALELVQGLKLGGFSRDYCDHPNVFGRNFLQKSLVSGLIWQLL